MLDKHIIENIERFVNAEITSRAHPGSSLSVIKEGEIIWSKGFGYENIKENKKAAPDTVYRCASVTKPVLTVGFLQLMEKGRFNLDDEVNSHLDVKIRDIQGDEPTLRDLLTHRSGMPTRVGPIYLLDEKPQAIKDYLESAARAIRPQGESWAYCNTGFMITFKPEIQDKLAQGYKRAGGPGNTRIPVSLYQLTTKPEAPSGSMYSTVMDLGNFIIMNMDGGSFKGKRVLKKETIDEMQKLQAPSGNSRSGMGLTWFYSIHDGRIMLNHTGGLPDFTNNVCFYPKEKVGVCWLSNLQDGSGWRPPSPTVLRLVMDEKPGYGDGFHKIPENWDKICGLYGDETRQVSLGIRNGYLVFNNRMFLERITDSTYIVRGLTSDGYELTIEYDEYEKATSISYGTTTLQRYSPVIHVIDTGLTLEGTWKGEYNDSYGFHVIELEIKDEAFGTIRDAQGETVSIDEFSVMDGKVTGAFKYILPETYARWGTREYFDVRLDLSAVGGQLIGYLKSGMSTIKITFNKTT
jgi:CubicO group peptidase (beta-lactamase class C family)